MNKTEIGQLLSENGFEEIMVSKTPTWVNRKLQEGIELDNGELKTFVMVGLERDYRDTPSQTVQDLVAELCGSEKSQSTGIAELECTSVIPDVITPHDLEDWKQKSVFERMLMFQSTPAELVKSRPGPGNTKLKYVKGNKMIQELNIAFLFDWNSYIDEVHETETGFWVRGSITVNMSDEKIVSRAAIGIADKHKGVNSEDVAKAAAMDMIKKAASTLGFNGDVYRGEV